MVSPTGFRIGDPQYGLSSLSSWYSRARVWLSWGVRSLRMENAVLVASRSLRSM
ncbi:hypothetical protein D3C78_1782310 [compost metagenome]